MSILDGILKNIGGAPDDVVNLARQVGLDPAMAEKAIAAALPDVEAALRPASAAFR